jgi:hypothetical protein
METILAITAGIGLAAACGFRVFVPLLATALAVHFGHFTPSPGLDWIGSTPSIIVLAVATALEIAGYYIPWFDHMLNTIASPAAVVAGTVVAATAFGDIHPAIKWAAAVIAGGGIAAGIQGTTVAARAASTVTTGGLANPIVSTIEAVGAVIMAILAIVLPILATVLAILMLIVIIRLVRRLRGRPAAVPSCPD